jgi:hypothetical protein
MLGWNARSWWCAGVAAAALAAGCSSAASDSVFESAGDSSGGAPSSGAASDGDESPNDTDPGIADTSGAGDSADEGDSSDPSDTGDAPEACNDVDCGNGSCESADGVTPQCTCDAGFAAIGLSCVACETHAADAGLDIPTMTGAIELTVAGLVPPKTDYEDATLWLRNRDSGDAVRLGNSHDDGPFAFTVVRGDYEVFYEHESGGEVLPRNRRARVAALSPKDFDGGATVQLDVASVHVHGAITIDGATPPDSTYDTGRLWLRDLGSGDAVLLGDTHEAELDVHVVPGSYALHYELKAGGTAVPSNKDALLYELQIVGVGSDDEGGALEQQLDVDITTVAIDGPITIDGQEPPSTAYENGRLRLVGGGDDEVVLGETKDGEYAKRVVPGYYEVVYERIAGSTMVPANSRAQLDPVFAERDGSLPIDIPVVSLAGAFTINQDTPPVDPGDDGLITLRTASGDAVVLGNTHDGGYARTVVPGYYDVYYGQDQSAGGVPTNTRARVVTEFDATTDDDARDIDIGLVTVTGTILVAGATPPTSDYDDGHIYLRDIETGDSALLASTRAGAFSAAVVPGIYDVVYVVETAGPELPINAAAVLDTVDVTGDLDFDVDVRVVELGGALSIDGAPPSMEPTDLAIMTLRDARTGDELVLGSTASGLFAQPVTPGDYLVFYRAQASTGMVPLNSNANLGCWTLAP